LTENNAKVVLTPLLSRFAKKDQLRITFEEICYTHKITDDDVKSYLSLLEDRIEEIEDVINMHIDLVKESIIQIKRDQLWRKIKNANNYDKKNENEEDDMDVIQQPINQLTPENAEKMAVEHSQQSEIVESKLKKDPELHFDTFSYE
jgi:predicted RND superfamily exporter protein